MLDEMERQVPKEILSMQDRIINQDIYCNQHFDWSPRTQSSSFDWLDDCCSEVGRGTLHKGYI